VFGLEDKKKVRLGVTSGILFVVVLAVLLVVNIVIDKLDVSWDLSQEGIYSISEQTKSILNGLEQDITIYVISAEDDFPIGYKQIINQYTKNSSHIKVVYRDLALYPNFAEQYMDSSSATVTESSLIVVCGDKHVYLDSDEYVSSSLNSDNSGYVTSLDFEPLLTSAINSVNDGKTYKLYCTTGHNELSLLSSTQTGLIRDNYEFEDWNIMSDDIPEDADIILINAPTVDFSKEECSKLQEFLNQGGKIYYIIESTVDLDNLTDLIAECGIQIEDGIVMEQDSSMIYGDTPTYMIPKVLDTDITKDFYESGSPLLVLVSKGLTEIENSDWTVTGIISTSDYAYSKVNLDSDYVSREDDDIMGPFYLAAVSEQEAGGKLLVLGSSNVLNDDVDEVVYGNNTDFFLNGVNYLLDDADKISIRSKEIEYDYNLYTSRQVSIISVISIIGIPLVLIILGVVIVIVRRKRSQNYAKYHRTGHDSVHSDVEEELLQAATEVADEAVPDAAEEAVDEAVQAEAEEAVDETVQAEAKEAADQTN
jgi:hypothetical protein